jgi:hypothetical protein
VKDKKNAMLTICLCLPTGTFEDPIVVKSAGDEIQAGCTGCPADSHIVRWLVVSTLGPGSPIMAQSGEDEWILLNESIL